MTTYISVLYSTMYNGHHTPREESSQSECEEKLLGLSCDEESCDSLVERRRERRCGAGNERRREVGEVRVETQAGGNFSRSNSFKQSLRGLVRTVSQKVVISKGG